MNADRRVVIIGGGFAGVKCARVLRKKLPRQEWDVVLFNNENHMVFHPMLAEVAGGSLNPDAVAAPLRQMLPRVHCRTEDVHRIDPESKTLEYVAHDGRIESLQYDHAVLACGASVNLGMVPGMADHAFPLKTVGDAVQLRAHVMQQLESMDQREATVLRMRFGLDDQEPRTLKEIGESLGLTRERVRQIETEALNKLAESLG